MARFLHRAALAVTKALELGGPECPGPFSGLFLASASPSGAGHLGLARASPALRDLLTPGAFLLDATHALGAVALRKGNSTVVMANRHLRDVFFPEILRRETVDVEDLRISLALLDAQIGRYQDALDTLTRLAAERTGDEGIIARLFAAALCDLLGRVDEANRWLAGIPEDECPCPRENGIFWLALVAGALGGAPAALAGYQGRVASAAFHIINDSVSAGKMSAFQIIVTGLLKHAAKRRCKDLALKHGHDGILRAVDDAGIALFGGIPKGYASSVLKASQALLSAVVLHARPLSGESIATALRVAERDLARAVEAGNAAAAADLRLLLAFLAARDGRFDEALARYEEVARGDPSDPRPHILAALVCLFVWRPVEGNKWIASYKRVLPPVSSFQDLVALKGLRDELVTALAVASPYAFAESYPSQVQFIVCAAGSRVDAALVSALRSKDLSVMERMEARAARAFLHAGMWSALKELEGKDGGSGTSKD